MAEAKAPRKTDPDHPVRLTREQAALYTAAVDEALAEIAEADGMARRGRTRAGLRLYAGRFADPKTVRGRLRRNRTDGRPAIGPGVHACRAPGRS